MDFSRLFAVICLVKVAASCETGRLFLGSINESYPLHLEKNGVYVQERVDDDGFPVYKHESRDYYIYHVSGTLLASSYWVVGEVPGSLAVDLSIQTAAATPDVAREAWRIWDSNVGEWLLQAHVGVKCVSETFGSCPSGRLRLHGLSPWNYHQSNHTGVYTTTGQTHGMRPVYRHGEAGAASGDFLYYVDGLWMVGPEVGKVTAALFVLDYAWRAEYIVDTWIVFNGAQFQRDSRLHISCAGPPADPLTVDVPGPAADEPELSASDVLTVAEGMLGQGDSIPVCDPTFCQNGGTCLLNEVNRPLCACVEGYTGLLCENRMECGDAPEIDNGHFLSQTGSRYHDMAFYACADDYQVMGDTAATCGASGHWEGVPSCVHWLDYLSPGVNPAGPNRRNHANRRSHHHHRTLRGRDRAQLEMLKSMF